MTINQLQNHITGTRAVEIAESVESAIASGALGPGDRLPTVRALADARGVSPTTVSAAFAILKRRGLLVTRGRRGTAVSQRPPLATPGPERPLPPGVRDLATGNPNPAFLPPLRPALDAIDTAPRLYGGEVMDAGLQRLARRSFAASGIPTQALSVTSGALDGVERALQAHLAPGDRVALEDPGFHGVRHLLASLGLVAVPFEVDDSGPVPASLASALGEGVQACVVTPRAQNPTGAALDARRIAELRPLLRAHADVLWVEDDFAGPASGAGAVSLCDEPPERWAVLRSVAKSYGPDLRLALMVCDPVTLARVEGRQLVGVRWVSFLLQRTVAALWKDSGVRRLVREGARAYARQRRALLEALAERGIPARGRSGLNVWVPVREEARALGALLDAGFAATPGERFRLRSSPGIRLTITTLADGEAEAIADALAGVHLPARRTLSA